MVPPALPLKLERSGRCQCKDGIATEDAEIIRRQKASNLNGGSGAFLSIGPNNKPQPRVPDRSP